jgi:alpha-1,2-mannosyltransferase
MVINLWLGQISAALTLLVLLDVAGVVPRRLQGILTGVAAAVKLTPLIFIPYFLVTRQWRQAVTATASFAVATGIGFVVYPQDSIAYWTAKIMQTSRVGELGVDRNHSLLGLLTRWGPDGQWTQGIWLAASALVVVAALAGARAHYRRGQFVAATVVVGCASLVVSPFSWPHHLVWIVLAGLWLAMQRSRLPVVLGAFVLASQSILWPSVPDGSPLALIGEVSTVVAVAISVLGLTRSASPDRTVAARPAAVPATP